jgi:glycerol-3-phosphate acyltransferase PlsX
MTADVDVVVADGFTGNVVLKTLEGGTKAVKAALTTAFGTSDEFQGHADALAPVLDPLYEVLDAETYGGAMLLGVDGVCIIAHGSSSRRAVRNAIAVAQEMVDADLVGHLRAAISAP